MNRTIPGIQVNVTTSTTGAVAFLDLTVFKHENRIAFRAYPKELNVYQYLPPQSQHNPACIRGYIKGEVIRYARTNTLLADRLAMVTEFRQRLLARSFASRYLDNILHRIDINDRHLQVDRGAPDDKVQTLVIPYNTYPVTAAFRHLIRKLNQAELAKEVGVSFRLAFTRPPNVMQLASRSSISDEQAERMQEPPPLKRRRHKRRKERP